MQRFVGFVYSEVRMLGNKKAEAIEVRVAAHASIPARCSRCQHPSQGYDRLPERRWQFVPLWGIPVWLLYAPRRVQCGEHGVVVEHIPWSDGKRPLTIAMMGFLARWARRLSWRETALVFHTSWESVFRSVDLADLGAQAVKAAEIRRREAAMKSRRSVPCAARSSREQTSRRESGFTIWVRKASLHLNATGFLTGAAAALCQPVLSTSWAVFSRKA